MNLAVHQHRIDNFAAIVHRDIAQKLHLARVAINFDDCDVRAERERKILWLEEVGCRKSWLHIGRKILGDVRGEGNVLNRDALAIRSRFGQSARRRFSVGHDWRGRLPGCRCFSGQQRKS